ncbi:hypothetical protein [Terrabacter sp. NPDC080008]|uniref:hypothetical protein n=1 Tax=Terrabacter sp. NPDC080008 TaxID=3155176 RepID=UPI00344C0CBB
MQRYEIVIDGELAADLGDPRLEVHRRESDGSTVLHVDAPDASALAAALEAALERLEALGIGVTGMHKVYDDE